MNRQIIKIQDPLLVMSVAVALIEIVGMIVLTTLARDIQPLFEWFLIVLPFGWILFILLMLLLVPSRIYRWATLPNENNVSHVLAVKDLIANEFAGLQKRIAIAKQELLINSLPQPPTTEETERPVFDTIVHEQLELIRELADSVRDSALEVAIACALGRDAVRCNSCSLPQLLSPDLICRRCKRPFGAGE